MSNWWNLNVGTPDHHFHKLIVSCPPQMMIRIMMMEMIKRYKP